MTTSYVLVVDDDASTRSVLRRLLEPWGYAVRTVENATQAIEMMLAEPATIAIIDIHMPGHDGLWLAGQIRQRWNNTAIIMATSDDDAETMEMGRQLGVVDYVLKPFGRDLLHQALQRASRQ